jgi:hypothetical protein
MSLGLLIDEGGRLVSLLFQMTSGWRVFAAIVSEDQWEVRIILLRTLLRSIKLSFI